MEASPHSVFISYSSDVADVATRLADELRTQGLVPWLASKELEPGQSFAESVRDGIKSSDAIAVVVGHSSSPFTTFEQSEIVKHGWEHEEARVLPVLVGDAAPPGFLRDRAAARIDPETGDGLDQVVELLRNPAAEHFVTRTPQGTTRLADRLSELDAQAAELDDPDR